MKIPKRKRQVKGYAWVKDFRRPIYGAREIKRGKFKGWVEVIYMASVNTFYKYKVQPKDIIEI